MQENLRIMLVDDSESRSLVVRLMLEDLGYLVVAEVFEPHLLYDAVRQHQPDVIIIDTESPSRDTLEHVALLSEREPHPIVMFSADRDQQTIRAAVRAGASAYVVDGLAPERVVPVIEAAMARFEAFQDMRRELAKVRTKLSERKVVERAKGVLMKARGISEEQAYVALRSMAMDRSISVGELARQLLSVSSLLA